MAESFLLKCLNKKQQGMKKILSIHLAVLLIVLSWSCGSGLKVTSDSDKQVDFKKYKTYMIYEGATVNDAISQLNRDRILAAIKTEMNRKGFQESTSSPELLVNPIAIFKDKTSVTANSNYYGYGGVYRPYYWGVAGTSSTTTYDVRNYKDGSLIIDVIDAGSKKLIWQGIGNKEIDGPVKDPDKRIPEAISMIMASFPPGAGKKS